MRRRALQTHHRGSTWMTIPKQPHILIRTLLTLLSWIFHGVLLVRHFLYDRHILKKTQAPLPVVSIGNIMAGGTGKTQVVLLLAEQLRDLSIAILSRGYRGKAERRNLPLVVNHLIHSP